MESRYRIVSSIVPAIEIILMGYFFSRFIKPFLKQKKGAFYGGMVYSLVMLLFRPLRLGYFMTYGVVMFAVFLVICRTDRRNYRQKAYFVVTFFSLYCFSSAIAEILYDNFYGFAEQTEYMAEHQNLYFPLYIGVCMLYLAAEVSVIAAGIGCIVKAYAYKQADMESRELFMLLIPSCIGAMGYGIMQYYRYFYIKETGTMMEYYDMLSCFYYAVSVILVVIVIVLYQSIRAKQEDKLQKELFIAQIDSIRQHIEQVEGLYQNIRNIRHDMANHLITLERLYARNELEEAKAYSTELKKALSSVTREINSGNPVTDVILQEIEEEAQRRKIRFELEFWYPCGSVINAFDISVILNNALQNALEHAKERENPYISVFSYCRKNAYMLEIRNSFSGNLQWDTKQGLPMTQKEAEGHGYGLANIRRVAEKYAGGVDIVAEHGEFCLSILMMMEG